MTERSPKSRAFRFGLGAFVLLGAFGALLWWRKHHPYIGSALSGTGFGLLLLSLASPRGALVVRAVWMRLAGAIGFVNSRIILGVLFFLLVTPIALVRRLRGREPYRWKPGTSGGGKGPGYWRTRDEKYDPKHYEHPY